MSVPKALIKSGLLAIYCSASKSDRVVGLEVVDVEELVSDVELSLLESELELVSDVELSLPVSELELVSEVELSLPVSELELSLIHI